MLLMRILLTPHRTGPNFTRFRFEERVRMFVVNYYAYRYVPFGRKKSGDAHHGPTRAVPCSVSPVLDYWGIY